MGLIDDVRDEAGNWKKYVCQNYMQWQTLSGRRWINLNTRCKDSGAHQKRQPTYKGCVNGFSSFNEFVDWSVEQTGYHFTDYELDKDLLGDGKTYSPEYCVFLPNRINTLLNTRKSRRGSYPIGVHFNKKNLKYISQCSDGSGKQAYLGSYDTPEKAFQVYKNFKESLVRNVAYEYKDKIDPRVYKILLDYKVSNEY